MNPFEQRTTNPHAWLLPAAEQVRKWREEDRRNGIVWDDEQPRDGERANNASPVNK